jgi:anti-anti-sigma regulatory factor
MDSSMEAAASPADYQRPFALVIGCTMAIIGATIAFGVLLLTQPTAIQRLRPGMSYGIGAVLVVQMMAAGTVLRVVWMLRVDDSTRQHARAAGCVEQPDALSATEAAQQPVKAEQLSKLAGALSIPLIPVTERVAIVPLVGAFDRERVQHIRQNLLHGIEQQRARAVLVDLTGVTEITPQAIEPFTQVIAAIEMMGCRVVLTGINAHIARTLIECEVHLPAQAHRDLMAGLKYALDVTTQTIAPAPDQAHVHVSL